MPTDGCLRVHPCASVCIRKTSVCGSCTSFIILARPCTSLHVLPRPCTSLHIRLQIRVHLCVSVNIPVLSPIILAHAPAYPCTSLYFRGYPRENHERTVCILVHPCASVQHPCKHQKHLKFAYFPAKSGPDRADSSPCASGSASG